MATGVKFSLQSFYEAARLASGSTDRICITGDTIFHQAVEEESCFCAPFSSIPEADQDVNRNTWQTLREALYESCPTELSGRVDDFCRRYGLDFERAKVDGTPLTVDHIERIGVGNSRVFVKDLHTLMKKKVAFSSCDEVSKNVAQLQANMYLGKSKPPAEIRGGPNSWSEVFFLDHFKWDKKVANLCSDMKDLYMKATSRHAADIPWTERVSKTFPTLEMEEGQVIPAPDGHGGVDYFVVFRKIATGHGLVAYALKPLAQDSVLTPTLMFRPTQECLVAEDTVETWFNDFEENIGELGYTHARDLLRALMENRNFRRTFEVDAYDSRRNQIDRYEVQDLHTGRFLLIEKIVVDAYSLGDAHAQRFLVDNSKGVREANLFNGPSIDQETAQLGADRVNARPVLDGVGDQLVVRIFRNRAANVADGDHADAFGNKHYGWHIDHKQVKVIIVEHQGVPNTGKMLGPHSARLYEPSQLDRLSSVTTVTYTEHADIDRELDNMARGEDIAWYERTRCFWATQVLYRLVYVIYRLATWLLSCFHIELFRSSFREEQEPIEV